jgi:hypothetical protein
MTEAMSRHEIEDVLSSIRRLVSHEDRADQPRAQTAAPAPAKLVLTSALRVDDVAESAQEIGSPPAKEPTGTVPVRQQGQDATPAFADAPVRAPLLTRIAQAGQLSMAPTASDAGMSTKVTPPAATPEDAQAAPTQSENGDPTTPLEEAVTDNVLEATLARLEEALSITPTAPDQAASETVIDEDALTQIVAKIVRQELQGELGERITRNIRKLVRAEVGRELQMRNL